MSKKPKKRRTKAEVILDKHRKEPSPMVDDPRQITIFDYEKLQAFAKLDQAIQAAMKRGRGDGSGAN